MQGFINKFIQSESVVYRKMHFALTLFLFQEYMRSMRVSNPRMREIQSEMENADVIR